MSIDDDSLQYKSIFLYFLWLIVTNKQHVRANPASAQRRLHVGIGTSCPLIWKSWMVQSIRGSVYKLCHVSTCFDGGGVYGLYCPIGSGFKPFILFSSPILVITLQGMKRRQYTSSWNTQIHVHARLQKRRFNQPRAAVEACGACALALSAKFANLHWDNKHGASTARCLNAHSVFKWKYFCASSFDGRPLLVGMIGPPQTLRESQRTGILKV